MTENKIIVPIKLGPEHEAYKVAIENLARFKDTSIFNNSAPEHAAIVLGNIFQNATRHVKIFAGNFNGAVSNNQYYLDSLKQYLDRKLPVSIIFEKEPNPNSLALALLKEYKNTNRISIRKISEGKTLIHNKHFTIADGRMFRLETCSENYQAQCSFNNPDVTNVLDSEFSALTNYAIEH